MKNIKGIISLLLSFSIFLSLFNFVAYASDLSIDISGETSFTFNGDSVTVCELGDANYEVTVYNSSDEESSALSYTDSNGDTVYYVDDSSDGELLITIKKSGGTYVFTGSGNGSIAVKKEAYNQSVICLNSLDLTSSFTSVISVRKGSTSTCTVYAVENTVNTLTDSSYNNDENYTDNAAAENSVMKFKDSSDVTITGGGTINIYAKGKNGIKANNLLTVENVTLNIEAEDNGISSENSITINSGTFNIVTSSGDGIKASDDDDTAGEITVNGGTFNITSAGDGIQASVALTVAGGNFNIQTANGYSDSSFDGNSQSCKGLKVSGSNSDSSENLLEISGGSFELNTADDAVHSNGYIFITGGEFSIKTGDDAVHADTSLTLGAESASDTELLINITYCYEGLEAGNVYIYSGTYDIVASDDGINSAGGSSNDSSVNTSLSNRDTFSPGGQSGRPGSNQSQGTASSDYNLNIYGGTFTVNTDSDALDSNGDLNLLGGTLILWGAAAGSDGEPMDCDGSLTISGATVFAAGSSSMTTSPSSDSQPYVSYGSSSNMFGGTAVISAGKTIQVICNSETIFSIEAQKNVNYILYSSSDMTSSSGWSIQSSDSDTTENTNPFSLQSFGNTFYAGSQNQNSYSTDNSSSTQTSSTSSTSTTSSDTSSTVTVTAGSGSTKAVYKIISDTKAVYKKCKASGKTAKVPDKITINGKSYKVVRIANNAFSGKSKLTKITIGKNVKKIGKKAFYKCKKLKTIIINSKKLTSVGNKAVTGIAKKAVIKVPSSKKKAYKKLFANCNSKLQ